MKTRTTVIAGAVLLAALARLIPHPPNFAPITAIALFGAATLGSKRLAILIPILAMFISDLGIEVLYRMGLTSSWGIHSGMWLIYATFIVITPLGFLLQRQRTVPAIAGATLAGSVIFFVVTNFAVWAGGSEYPRTVEGLIACYTLAIPFFQYTVLGDLFYSTVLFGGFALAEKMIPELRSSPGQLDTPLA
jgi:hypothetical protein